MTGFDNPEEKYVLSKFRKGDIIYYKSKGYFNEGYFNEYFKITNIIRRKDKLDEVEFEVLKDNNGKRTGKTGTYIVTDHMKLIPKSQYPKLLAELI